MKDKRTIVLILCGALLTVSAIFYVIFQKGNLSKTICKAPNPKASSTLDKNSPSKETGINSSKDNPAKDSPVNTLGNTMDNIQNRGLAAQQGKWVYYNCNGLCKVMDDMKTGWKRLNWDSAQYINVIGDWIYYVRGSTLYKMKTDGSERRELSKENCYEAMAVTRWLFYVNVKDTKLYRMDLNGENVTKLSDGSCLGFFIQSDWLYFDEFDAAGKEQIYKMNLDGSNKTTASPSEVNLPILPKESISFNRSKDYAFYITHELKLYKFKVENNQQGEPAMICDISKYTTSNKPILIALDNFLLIYFDYGTDYNKYKIDFNGNIEKLTE